MTLQSDNVGMISTSRQVKLLDFGIATDTDMAPEQRLTRAGFFVGTLMYVAPEALSGELVSPAADQYSLATIAYLLLTGCLPFTAKTPREMFSQLLSQPPIHVNAARPNLRFPASALNRSSCAASTRIPASATLTVRGLAQELADALSKTEEPVKGRYLLARQGHFQTVALAATSTVRHCCTSLGITI